ncbi:hypothetical protein BKA61DRAFT_614386 [Leptodontidium sp. MPI-SDFR-AT-0119]|nr:hypothetical protein BKA61DRAFT_614386 [Leptodontidium sp. MPI-SDFR-AT-0119]
MPTHNNVAQVLLFLLATVFVHHEHMPRVFNPHTSCAEPKLRKSLLWLLITKISSLTPQPAMNEFKGSSLEEPQTCDREKCWH